MMTTTTDRFTHEGRPLASWLLQLVEDSEDRRRSASKVITDRFYLPLDLIAKQQASANDLTAQFQSAVRDTLRNPDFPAADFVRKLFSLSMALEARRMDEWRAQDKEDDEWHEQQAAKLGTSPSPAQVRRYLRRICVRLWRLFKTFGESPGNESFATGLTITWVIEGLGAELLPAASLIRHMLTETHQSYIASGAICRMGPAAREFYPDLIAGLGKDDPNGYCSKPLGILLQNDPGLIPEVFRLVDDTNPTVRNSATTALAHCGRATLRAHPEIEAKLRERMRCCPESEWYVCAHALGEIAVTGDSVSLLLEATHPPAGERTPSAIDALGRIGLSPERVVPRLIEFIGQFSEPDPDWTYHGAHSRIICALGNFGTAANAAIPILAKWIWTTAGEPSAPSSVPVEGSELDQDVVKFLGERGPAAREALSSLLEARAEMIRRGLKYRESENRGEDEGPLNEEDLVPDYLKEAIRKIGGEPEQGGR